MIPITIISRRLNKLRDEVDNLISGGISDGDKGDITVSSGGTIWTVDSGLNHSHTKSQITDFPTVGTTTGTICAGDDSRLSDARTPTTHTHVKADITDFPVIGNAPVYSRVTGVDFTTTSTSLVAITGLSNELLATSVYEVELVLHIKADSTTTGIRFGVNYSAAGATIEATAFTNTTSTAARMVRINAFNTNNGYSFCTTANGNGAVHLRGIVETGVNSGNLTAQLLKTTSGTATCYINSYLKTTKI